MDIIEILVLGFIQGIAEFLPISSSAHLIIFRDIFGIGAGISANMELTFDIALHFGTLLAIGVFFFSDFIQMIKKGFTKGVKDDDGKILWYLVAATIPAAIVGVLFEDAIENVVRSNYIVIALALAIMGIIIYLADKFSKETKDVKKMTLKDAIVIGCSQVFALIPGFSRSGTTIAAGRVLGLDRESAAKFSFFLSAPVVLGAVVLQLFKGSAISVIAANLGTFILGILVSFVVGLLCIKYLLKYLQKHNFKIFMVYRVVLAIVVLIYIFVR
ncbi:MAG: undecaprenyl-diphosphatase UppP [bacterium]|nr:undecaprenyl-diphosphatase UppP [Mycoplasmatota bacterium]MDD6756672.1 undecaprenyl-diphosphatase UppP [bacterium]MDY2907895.1 undecaprenyl-diphosphatase UppP [Candidatus Faecimonas sp.]